MEKIVDTSFGLFRLPTQSVCTNTSVYRVVHLAVWSYHTCNYSILNSEIRIVLSVYSRHGHPYKFLGCQRFNLTCRDFWFKCVDIRLDLNLSPLNAAAAFKLFRIILLMRVNFYSAILMLTLTCLELYTSGGWKCAASVLSRCHAGWLIGVGIRIKHIFTSRIWTINWFANIASNTFNSYQQ